MPHRNSHLTYKQKFNKKYNQPLNEGNTLKEISDKTNYKLSGLQTIFNKGSGAFRTNREAVRPHVKSADQWAMARVYASINKGSKSYQVDKAHLVKK